MRHPQLADDLTSTALLIAEYAGSAVALRKIGEIEETIRKLRQTPHVGSIIDDIAPGLRAIPAAQKGVQQVAEGKDSPQVRRCSLIARQHS